MQNKRASTAHTDDGENKDTVMKIGKAAADVIEDRDARRSFDIERREIAASRDVDVQRRQKNGGAH